MYRFELIDSFECTYFNTCNVKIRGLIINLSYGLHPLTTIVAEMCFKNGVLKNIYIIDH